MTLAIGGLGVGLGAIYPRFEYNNIASIPMGFGGLLFMVSALLSVTLTVTLEALPIYLYITGKLINKAFDTWEVTQTTVCLLTVIVVNVACFYVPLKLGNKSIENEK